MENHLIDVDFKVMDTVYLLDDLSLQYSGIGEKKRIEASINELKTLRQEGQSTFILDVHALTARLAEQIHEGNGNYDEIIMIGRDGERIFTLVSDQYLGKYKRPLFMHDPIFFPITRITRKPSETRSSIYFESSDGTPLERAFAGLAERLGGKKVLLLDDVFFTGKTALYILENMPEKAEYDLGVIVAMEHFLEKDGAPLKRKIRTIFIGKRITGTPMVDFNILNTKDLIDDGAIKFLEDGPGNEEKLHSFPFYKAGEKWLRSFFPKNPKRAYEICRELEEFLEYNKKSGDRTGMKGRSFPGGRL